MNLLTKHSGFLKVIVAAGKAMCFVKIYIISSAWIGKSQSGPPTCFKDYFQNKNLNVEGNASITWDNYNAS